MLAGKVRRSDVKDVESHPLPSLVTGGRDMVAGCQFKFKWPALAASSYNVYISSDPAWPERGAQ